MSDLLIGAYCNDIMIDHALDWVELTNVKGQVMWNVMAGTSFPQPIDAWVLNNSVFLRTCRVDSLQAANISCFGRFEGHQSIDSTDSSQNYTSGYGRLVNVDFDYVAYGIVNQSSNSVVYGYKYSNLDIGSNNSGSGTSGQVAILNQSGGNSVPYTTANCGSIRGTWAGGTNITQAGNILATDIRGI